MIQMIKHLFVINFLLVVVVTFHSQLTHTQNHKFNLISIARLRRTKIDCICDFFLNIKKKNR